MKRYYVLGTRTLTLPELRNRIANALTLSFSEYDSDFLGGRYYRAGDIRHEHLIVLMNTGEEKDDLPYPGSLTRQ
jgi:hypothetical protein